MTSDKSQLPPAFGGPEALDLDHCDVCGALIVWGDISWGLSDSNGRELNMCDRCGRAMAAELWS